MGSSVPGISVVIPVGPNPVYKIYLEECLDTVLPQFNSVDELIVVDDMSYLDPHELLRDRNYPGMFVYQANRWLLGCASCWNVGIGLARNEWCIMMGSDDMLVDGALDACRDIIANNPDPLGWYNFTCEDSEGEEYSWHNNAAMVSKSLWSATGGFPITAALGAPDALLISIMLVHFPEHLHKIKEGTPLYFVRVHPEQNGKQYAGAFPDEVVSVRNKETARWTPPTWTQNL